MDFSVEASRRKDDTTPFLFLLYLVRNWSDPYSSSEGSDDRFDVHVCTCICLAAYEVAQSSVIF